MKYKHLKTIFVAAIFLSVIHANSQSIRITSATRQGWAGGICCNHGTNYNIQLEIIRTKLPITLDTLWLEGHCKDLSKYNQKKSNPTDTIKIQIQEGISFTGREHDLYLNEVVVKGCYDENKTGVTIEYRIGKKKKFINVSPYITELMFLAYP